MALYKALYKMWSGVLEWSIGVRESIVEAWVVSWNLKHKNTQTFYYLSILWLTGWLNSSMDSPAAGLPYLRI